MILMGILDGFGLRCERHYNAVIQARKPNLTKLYQICPNTSIRCSGSAVGLPEGQMGNSEVGHLNFGAGRIVYQDITRIDKAIADGDFFDNAVLVGGMSKASAAGSAVHLFGLVSDGGVHSSLDHLKALTDMAKKSGVKRLYLHAFMDGRDTPPRSGAGYMKEVMKYFREMGLGRVATVMGRYYGMDRDKRWDRTEKAYQAIVNGRGEHADDPVAAIEASYGKDTTDEFIVPTVLNSSAENEGQLQEGDVALFFNFRADRVRQLCYMLVGRRTEDFSHPENPAISLITMTNYDDGLVEARVAFPPQKHKNIFGEILAQAGLRQLRIAETEKYAHVTYFFNGGVEEAFENEERVLIPSPKVATYDLKPEMSAAEVATEAEGRILSGDYDVMVLNFANCDMVGHTGDFKAAMKAVEAVDAALGRVMEAVDKAGGQAIITADHGNAEQMYDAKTDGPHTAHTTNPVPFLYYDSQARAGKQCLRTGGILADVAPTILHLLNIKKPAEMTGRSLFISSEVPVYRH